MRSALPVLLCLGVLAACEPEGDVSETSVVWMDWPAEIDAHTPFRTRLVVWGVCAENPRFRPGPSANQEAVTFAPYFLVDGGNVACAAAAAESFVVLALDTAGTAPGLAALVSRTYEMRGAVQGVARVLDRYPIRIFGDVHVVPGGGDGSRRNAAGFVYAVRDSVSCVRILPVGSYGPTAGLVLEDQADTAGLSHAFVSGYIHEAAAPVCGETRVFHLLSRN